VRFAAQHKDVLAELPVAYFALCELLRDATPEHRQQALRFLDPLTAIASPITVEVFAGARNLQHVNPLLRWLLMHVLMIREGDWRDWDQISAWSATLQRLLAARDHSRRHVA
jgi:menaquinone-dependent protoporphyrinogen IX oxidase